MTKKKGCIAVLAKTPGLSPLKTRLAVDIGQESAEEIYTLCVQALQNTLIDFCEKNLGWDVVWALGEEHASAHGFWLSRPFRKIWTKEGSFGARLCHVDTMLKSKYQSVILIGTDCPHIPSSFFKQALDYLIKDKIVVGPSTDGGYYLFGSSATIPLDVWEAVPYSQKDTLQKFIALLDDDSIEKIPPLTDLDEKNEIIQILDEIKTLDNPIEIDLLYKLEEALQ